MVAGVAGGTAQYLGVDPTFVRLGFVVAAFFGGFGLLAYLVMAVVVPQDDGTGNPVEGRPPTWAIVLLAIVGLIVLPGPFFGWGDGWFFGMGMLWLLALIGVSVLAYRAIRGDRPLFGSRGGASGDPSEAKTQVAGAATGPSSGEGTAPRVIRLLAYSLLVMAAIGAAVSAAALGAFATATGNGAIVAGIVIALGVGLAATAFFGDGAKRSAPWLLAVALILAIPSGAVAAADVRFDGGIGERNYSPATAAEIPADGYELGIGQMKVDLRELDIPAGETVRVPAELGLGQLIVSVPSGACVTGHAEAKGGDLRVRGESNTGASPEFDRGDPAPGPKLPQVEIDAELQFGQLVVTDRAPDDFDGSDRGPGPGRDGDHPDELTDEPADCAG
jgi:phage shock protein PspC (stress-responsive transcriptional regulator)